MGPALKGWGLEDVPWEAGYDESLRLPVEQHPLLHEVQHQLLRHSHFNPHILLYVNLVTSVGPKRFKTLTKQLSLVQLAYCTVYNLQ